MKKLIFLGLFAFASFFSKGQWSYLGLGNTNASQLIIFNDTIYASTNDGIFKKNLFSNDTTWIACGMQGNHVVQTFVIDNQTFISIVEIGSTYTTQIYKSTDGGSSFSLLHPGISSVNNYQYLNAMAHPEGSYDTLYFLNHCIRTFDGGLHWDTIECMTLTNRFIAVNPSNHNQIIIGGETFILSAYLQTSFDRGDTWAMTGMANYFNGDNCVHDLAFDGNEWYAAGEGVICKTVDGGDNWVQLLNTWSFPPSFGLYNWDIELSPADNNKIYVTGSNSNAIKVPLIYSGDRGMNWDTLSFTPVDSSNPEIKSLAIKNTANGDKVFLGGHGVYLYENNFTTGIDNSVTAEHTFVYPNPFESTIHVSVESKSSEEFNFTLTDVSGREIIYESFSAAENNFNLSGIPAGVYSLKIMTPDLKVLFQKKVIKLTE